MSSYQDFLDSNAEEEVSGSVVDQGSTEPTLPQPQQQVQQPEQQQPQQDNGGIDLSPSGMAQGFLAPIAGTADFGISLINSITPDSIGDIPELPELPSSAAQSTRQISEQFAGDIIFAWAARRLGLRGLRRFVGSPGGKKLVKKLPNFIQKSPSSKKIIKEGILLPGEIGASVAATGVTFDMEDAARPSTQQIDPETGELVTTSYGGQNVLTMWRNWAEESGLPKWSWTYIPTGLIVGENDSPEMKRAKNMYEAGLFPVGTTLVGHVFGALNLARKAIGSSFGVDRAVQTFRIPIDDTAKKADAAGKLNPTPEYSGSTKSDLHTAMNKSEAELDEIGRFNLEQNGPNIDKPIKGVHDMFDDAEINLRTRDNDGVAGAMDDVVRIDGDIGTYNGRVGNPFPEAAVQRAVAKGLPNGDLNLLDDLVQEIKEVGKFDSILPNGRKITPEMREKIISKYSYLISNPKIPAETVAKLQRLINKLGVTGKAFTYEGQLRGLEYLTKSLDPDRAKGKILAQMSLSGQASDMATSALENANTMIGEGSKQMVMDRLKLLYYLKQVDAAEAGHTLRNQGIIQKNLGKESIDEMMGIAEELGDLDPSDLKAAAQENANRFGKTLDLLAKDPEATKVFLEAVKAFNGRPDAMQKLLDYTAERFGSLEKGFIDNQPKIKQAFLEDLGAMVYNNVLSSTVTGLNAVVGNIGGLADQIIVNGLGSLVKGDWNQIASLGAGLRSMFSMHSRHLKAGAERLGQAIDNPESLNKLRRSEDLILQDEQATEATRLLGEYLSKKKDNSLKNALEYHKVLKAWANDPLLRVVPNFMMSADAVTSSMMASFEAGRLAHYGRIVGKGKLRPIKSSREFSALSNRYYRQMLDENGVLREGTYASQEAKRITLTAESKFAETLNNATARVPLLRTIFMFPRTLANVANITLSYTPISQLPVTRRFNAFRLPSKQLSDQQILDILKKQGYDKFVGGRTPRQTYDVLRTNVQIRAYSGSMITMTFALLASSGSITGAGSVDRDIQIARDKLNWQPYSIKVGNTWVSYKWMGPLAKVIGMGADLVDNFNRADESWTEGMFMKISLIFASMFEDENLFSMLRPVMDLTDENRGPRARARWAAQTANNFIPSSAFLSDIGQIINPAVENLNRDFAGYFVSRQPILGLATPDERNVVTGEVIGHDINPFQRALNALTPFKSRGVISPVEQMLIDVEFDAEPYIEPTRAIPGVDFTADQREFYTNHMSKDTIFHDELKSFYEGYKSSGIWEELKRARRDGVESDVLNSEKYKQFKARLKAIWARARKRAQSATFYKFPGLEQEASRSEQRDKMNELGIILDLN